VCFKHAMVLCGDCSGAGLYLSAHSLKSNFCEGLQPILGCTPTLQLLLNLPLTSSPLGMIQGHFLGASVLIKEDLTDPEIVEAVACREAHALAADLMLQSLRLPFPAFVAPHVVYRADTSSFVMLRPEWIKKARLRDSQMPLGIYS
jgi:hypothetical protein